MAHDPHADRASSAAGTPLQGGADAEPVLRRSSRVGPGDAIDPDADPAGLGPPFPEGVASLDRLRALLPGAWRDASGGRPEPMLRRAASAVVVVVVGLLLVGGWLAIGRPSDASDADRAVALPGFGTGSSPARPAGSVGSSGPGGTSGREPGTTAPAMVQVHAAGAVVAPGVRRLPAGARVADLVAAAGGLAPDADVDRVNLAAVLVDGSRVYVPRRGESSVPNVPAEVGAGGGGGGGAGPSTPKGPVDLNTASVEELDTLPGVGPTTAQAIIDHRSRNGPFRSVEDLAKVRGIGPAKLAELRPLVTV